MCLQVTFIGAEAKIDQLRSGVWLERKTKDWEFTVNVHMNMPRYAHLFSAGALQGTCLETEYRLTVLPFWGCQTKASICASMESCCLKI